MNMKLLAIILVVVGILALVYQQFSYTKTEKDAQLGPIEIQHDETHTIPISPLVGVGCIVAGVVILATGGGRR